MKVIIPAGGFGTRLRPLTYTRPKSLLPIYNTTILGFILDHLSNFNVIDEVIIAANKEFRQIESVFKNSYKELKIKYIWEEKRMGGVACIKNASKNIEEDFLVFLGDNLSDVNITEFTAFHKRKESDASIMLVKSKTPWLYGVPVIDENDYITSLIEKPKNIECKEAYIATGIYIFKKDALESVDEKQFIDHTGEIFPIILTAGKKVSGFKTSFYWSDIGDFKNYLETNRWVLEHKRGKIKPSSNNIDGLSYTASPSIADNSCVESSIILKGAVVKGKCRIINSMIYENTIIGEEASIINSIIAENTVVEEQVSVENSIIGANTLIKANSNIKDAKIWPRMIIETGGIVKGTIQHDYLPLK